MLSPECDDTARADALRIAAEKHVARMRACMAGMGVERHLYGLQMMYAQKSEDLGMDHEPALFRDPGWKTLRHDILSTTSNPDPHGVEFSGFGPVVDGGFGIVYFIKNNAILLIITSRTSMKDALEAYITHFSESLSAMAGVLKHTER
jgi:carnitine O-acetyltransferase